MSKVVCKFFIIILLALHCACLSQKSLSHQSLTETIPNSESSGLYGCYKNKCRAPCPGLPGMPVLWCYTNSKGRMGMKNCSSDDQCDGYYNKCQTSC